MQPYPLWKFLVLILVGVLGAVYALPNLYGMQPAVQISTQSGDPLPADFGTQVDTALAGTDIKPESSKLDGKSWVVRFDDATTQLRAFDVLSDKLPNHNDYIVALNL